MQYQYTIRDLDKHIAGKKGCVIKEGLFEADSSEDATDKAQSICDALESSERKFVTIRKNTPERQ